MQLFNHARPIATSRESLPSMPRHGYYPISLELPNFVANDRSLSSILTEFVAMWTIVLGLAWIVATRYAPSIGTREKATMLWFVLCGTLHIIFEGYFITHGAELVSQQHVFAQLWKEYALSDSRYLTGDLIVMSAEVVTVMCWGPLSYLTAWTILRSSPWRHPLQIIVCVAHLYGDVLYLSTSLVDMFLRDTSHSRPEPLYFWVYFLFLNGIWLVVPSILLFESVTTIKEAIAGWQEIREVYQARGGITASKTNGHLKAN